MSSSTRGRPRRRGMAGPARPLVTLRALDAATAMAREQGTGTVVVRRAHHIGCLAAYVKRAADAG